jgi:beta-glucanase (GH16 family)
MKRFLLAAVSVFPHCIQNPGAVAKPPVKVQAPPEWQLAWEDSFDGDAIDTSKWSFQLAHGCELGICGWGNNELQYYTSRPKNARVEEGNLVLQAYQEPVDSSITALYPGYGTDSIPGGYMWRKKPDTIQHTSARLSTKIPEGGDGAGCWPAIWMLPTDTMFGGWPKSGEMDIMEAYGPAMDTIHQTFHWWGGEGTKGSYVQTAKALGKTSWADEYHVYGIIWTPEKITTYIDGQVYVTRTNNGSLRQFPYVEKFHLILNIAIGGAGLRGGVPFGLTEYPQTMKVDWVKVYQDKNLKADT